MFFSSSMSHHILCPVSFLLRCSISLDISYISLLISISFNFFSVDLFLYLSTSFVPLLCPDKYFLVSFDMLTSGSYMYPFLSCSTDPCSITPLVCHYILIAKFLFRRKIMVSHVKFFINILI